MLLLFRRLASVGTIGTIVLQRGLRLLCLFTHRQVHGFRALPFKVLHWGLFCRVVIFTLLGHTYTMGRNTTVLRMLYNVLWGYRLR